MKLTAQEISTRVDKVSARMRPFQPKLFQQLLEGKRLLELWYGGGKCLISMEFALACHEKEGMSRVAAFVYCKARNMLTWKRELLKHFPHLVLLINPTYEETCRQLVELKQDQAVVVAYSQSLVAKRVKEMIGHGRTLHPSCLILDESTCIKNPGTQIAKAFHEIKKVCPVPTIAMTGNAIPEGPQEIWSQFQYAYGDKNPLGVSYYAFRKTYFIDTGMGWTLDASKRDALFTLLTKYVCTLDAETMPLYKAFLAQFNIQRAVELYEESAEQRRLLDYLYTNWALPRDPSPELAAQMEENFEPSLDALSSDIEMSYSFSILQKAQQIASGFYYDEAGTPIYLKTNPKLDQLEEVLTQLFIENPKRQVIVWSAYLAERPPIEDMLMRLNLRYVIGASDESLLSFTHSDTMQRAQVIILSPRQSQGFNELREADVSIFYSNSYSQELRNQAETRNTGARQAHPLVTLIDLCGPRLLDMDVVTALQAKNFSMLTAHTLVNKYASRKKEQSAS